MLANMFIMEGRPVTAAKHSSEGQSRMMPTKSSTAKVKVVKLTQKAGEAASGAGSKSVLTVGSSQVGY